MELRVGTSGFSYKGWKGPFYPEKLPAAGMLAFYAERLPAVEINNTFYRMPRSAVLEAWAEQVPEAFRFSVKASRRITHFKRLKGAEEETGYLVKALAALGERLGVVLFQLPPNLKADAERLAAFQDLLPEDLPVAFEFRHESWHDEPVFERLRARGHALVRVDAEGAPPPELVTTSPRGYLRLRRPGYAAADLDAWAVRLRETGWQEAFVFFKHEDAGAGPRLAADFLEAARRAAPGPRRARRAQPAARKTG
jgi:uncharacterized protein YecE (DUF72 family)